MAKWTRIQEKRFRLGGRRKEGATVTSGKVETRGSFSKVEGKGRERREVNAFFEYLNF